MLKLKLQEAADNALKAHDSTRLNTVRMVLSEVQNKEIDKKIDLTDEEILQLIQTNRKKLEEAITLFEKAGRVDLVEEYTTQIKILQEYLPEELSEEQIKEEVKKIIANNPDSNPNALIGLCIRELHSKAPSHRVASIVKEITSS